MTRPNEYHWTFGNGDHLEFVGGGAPIVTADAQLSPYEGCATISHPVNGELLFYTDGHKIWDAIHTEIATDLGGDSSSSHSAIIVPPPPGGSHYHIFATKNQTDENDLIHSSYSVTGWGASANVTQINPPAGLLSGALTSERIAATSNSNCSGYWIVTQEVSSDRFHVISVTSDTPQVLPPKTISADPQGSGEVGCMKFSHDGRYLAYCDHNGSEVVVFDFDNSTGSASFKYKITDAPNAYGLEFSPDNNILYFSTSGDNAIRAFTIASGPMSYADTRQVHEEAYIYALQLGPDGVIYGKRRYAPTLLAITNPNSITPVVLNEALDANNGVINLQPPFSSTGGNVGLPTFTRIADDCVDGTCERIAEEVNTVISERAESAVNRLRECNGQLPSNPACREQQLPPMRPHIKVNWGGSDCDCIESDDTEIVSITVCNTYSNIQFDGFMIHKLEAVDANGDPVAILHDGTPFIQLVPVGPYCFGNIGPCSCISREFVLHNRGAMAGEYHIRVSGICYDVNLHYDETKCFKFDICKD